MPRALEDYESEEEITQDILKVFEEENFPPNHLNYGWDGCIRGKRASNSVFIYFAEIEFIDGNVEVFQGSFSALK